MEKNEEMETVGTKTEDRTEPEQGKNVEKSAETAAEQSEEMIETAEDGNGDIEEQLQAELVEAENRRLRLLADYENFKRRAALDKEALQKYRSQSVLTNLIPILDNFERALAVEAKEDEARSMMEGMDMIYRSLTDALKAEGLVEIEARDQEFDPNFHQAIMTDHVEDKPSGIVLEELQKGYILKDRVLRPSMVKVNE